LARTTDARLATSEQALQTARVREQALMAALMELGELVPEDGY
jgi:hypothetical protein